MKGTLKAYLYSNLVEAGCDEAGRGCLAGPVVAAAVILPNSYYHPLLNDSKQVNPKNRKLLREDIEKKALAWAVGAVYPREIDEFNILKSSFLAMHRAIEQLNMIPEFLLIDGNRFTTYPGIPHQCIIKGDEKYYTIAAASILAKTHRDEYMSKIHAEYPSYGWNTNQGYPTKLHREQIKAMGITPYHRLSFTL